MVEPQDISVMPGQDASDESLLRQIAAADKDALTLLYTRYHERLFKFVFRLTRSYSATDEIVNDIMLATWRSAGNYRGDSKASTWIFGIAYRQALKHLSRKQLNIAPQIDVERLADTAQPAIDREQWVKSGLAALPATQRIAVELVFYLGLSYDEVASITECPVNTVKTRMYHARRKLKEHLESTAGGDSQGYTR